MNEELKEFLKKHLKIKINAALDEKRYSNNSFNNLAIQVDLILVDESGEEILISNDACEVDLKKLQFMYN